jgi:hypothetical protein
LYDFNGGQSGDLAFRCNDVIVVLRQEGEWWEGELNGKRGIFPYNYVELL